MRKQQTNDKLSEQALSLRYRSWGGGRKELESQFLQPGDFFFFFLKST